MVVCPACNSRYEEGITFCPRDGTHVVNDNSPTEVGKVLADRYRIVRKLGEGGMGEVYEAQHVYIEKKFAIKLLRTEIMSNQEAVTRFQQEARAASAIGHENIVEIDDFGRLPDGRAYLAMEYLEGVALADAAKEPLTIPRAVEVMRQVCTGLAAAHEKNIIHRDMKPENVFLVHRQGREVAKILDFGIAKVSGHDNTAPNLTRTGTIFGTPHYMSPEQALGKHLDKRTDVYSVGVIMYEIFTGAVPFRGDSFMAILTQHITATPARPRDVAPGRNIPEEVENAILKAMSKEPDGRFANMVEMANELARIQMALGGAPAQPQRTGGYQPTLLAADVLAARSHNAMAAAGSQAAMPRTGTPAPRTAAPVPRTVAPVQAAQSVAAQPAYVEPPIIDASPPKKKSSVGLILAISGVALAAAGGGGGYYYYTHFMNKPAPVVTNPPPVQKDPPPVVQKPAVKDPEKSGEPPAVVTKPKVVVLLDTRPQGASIIRDGQHIDETPANVEVAEGERVTFELHRDGSRDEEVVVDGSKKKVIVTLHKARAGEQHHHPTMPSPPPVNKPVPPPTQRPVAEQQPPVASKPPVSVEHVPDTTQPPPGRVEIPTGGPPPPLPTRGGAGRGPVVIPPAPLGQIPPKPKKQPVPRKGTDIYERVDKKEEPLDPYK
jgi:serine/threonine-protein kinase